MKLLKEHKIYKKYYFNLIISAYLLYTFSIAIKMVYSAQIVEIGPYYGVDKAELSLGLTIYYLIYAVSQLLISGVVKKINLRYFIAITTILSGLTFGSIVFLSKLWQVWLVLGINGVLQIGIWGGTMSIFGKYLPDYMTTGVTQLMSSGMAVGTFLAYGFSALFTTILNWKYTFLFFGILTVLTAIYFFVAEKSIEANVGKVSINRSTVKVSIEKENRNKGNSFVFVFLSLMGILSLLACTTYYSLTNWVPSLLKEVHNVPSSYSMLISLLIPVGVFFGPFFSTYLCQKNKNYFFVGIPMMLISGVCALTMVFVYDVHILVAIIIPLVILFVSRGYTNVLLSYVPLKMRNVVETGKSSLILNAFGSLSAAITPFLSATLMENYGWEMFFAFLSVICCLCIVLLLIGSIWQKKKNFFQ